MSISFSSKRRSILVGLAGVLPVAPLLYPPGALAAQNNDVFLRLSRIVTGPDAVSADVARLSFPFYRPMRGIWNALFLDKGNPIGAINVKGKAAERGRLPVETLGHCTACHTPRDELMQQNSRSPRVRLGVASKNHFYVHTPP